MLLTLLVLAGVALATAFVLTRAVACVAMPVSDDVAALPPSERTEQPPRETAEANAEPVDASSPADAGAVGEDEGDDPAHGPAGRRRSRRASRHARAAGGDDEEPARSGPRVVPRSQVERVIADPSELRGASVRLRQRDGEPVGLELSGVAPGGPLARIGLRNGDVLVSVNGITVHDADGAVDALTRLRAESDFRVRILRGGAARTLTYRVE